ncbi:MAG: DUF2799 domain-containing protein [Gammaproteobacteria bacterium]|nr:DUF2799 domain-containing protein [Gammaproteobacteria bacterium]
MEKLNLSKSYKIILTILALAGLSACVPHLNKQQCLSMNWYSMGYEDGSQGKYQRDLSKDIQDCARFKLTVNTVKYHRGWQAGVRQFCQPNTAYNLGVNGATYNNICPRDLAAKFNRAYRHGLRKFCVPPTGYNIGRAGKPLPDFCAPDQVVAFRNAYADGRRIFITLQNIQNQINDLNGQIGDLNNQIGGRQNDIHHLQHRLVRNKKPNGKPYSGAERELILLQIRDDRSSINGLQGRIEDLQDQINHLRDQQSRVQSRS